MSAPRRLRAAKVPWLEIVSVSVLVFLFAPICIIILFSFNQSAGLSFPMGGLSVRWYRDVVTATQFRRAVSNTLVVGTVTSLIAMTAGTLAALGLTRYRFRVKPAITALTMLPVSVPLLFIGTGLLSYFALLNVKLSLLTVIVAHVVYTLPYFVIVTNARLERFDIIVEEAARDLGATPWQTFWRVTFPIIAPSVAGGGILVFALSFDEFLITFFVIGSETTLPMLIWSMMRRSLDPRVNVISSLVLAVSLVLVLLMARFVRISEVTV